MTRLALLAAIAIALLPAAAAAETASLPDIEDEVMCPICGTTLELSNAPQAERERAFIRRLIAQGRSKQEIKDALVAEYGEEVLAVPENSGFDLTAWLLPAIGFVVAPVALLLVLLRSRRRPSERDRPAAPLERAEAERLDRDLSRYDV